MSGVPGLERGVAILRLFHRDRTRLSAPQIAKELRIPRSTVHRLLMSLIALGLLQRDEGGVFMLGPGILSLGYEYLASQDIINLANPVLSKLRDDINCSTHLIIRIGRRVVYLSRHQSRTPVLSSVNVGMSLPAHATVVGRLLLGALSSGELRDLYKLEALEPVSAKSPRNLRELESLIATDRKLGYALSVDYYARGITTIAAPVYGPAGTIVAAINAASITGTFNTKTLNGPIKSKVLEAAEQISVALGAPRDGARSGRATS